MNTIEALVSEFTAKLTAAIQADMQNRLQAALSGSFAPAKRGPGRPPKAAKGASSTLSSSASKRPLSAKRKETMARQGKYMAVLRQLKGAKLAKVRSIAKKDGVEAALAFSQTILN